MFQKFTLNEYFLSIFELWYGVVYCTAVNKQNWHLYDLIRSVSNLTPREAVTRTRLTND